LLDLSKNRLASVGSYGSVTATPEGPKLIADAIKDMGALSIANFMGNSIGKEMLSNLQEIMRSKPNLVSLCGIADDATEADLSGLGMDADDAVVLASELPDKGALTSLNISKNRIEGAEAGKALGDALAGNTVLKELDLSGKEYHPNMDIGFVKAFTPGLCDNGAILSLNLSNNQLIGKKRVKQKEKPSWWEESKHGVHGSTDDDYDTIPDTDGIIAVVNAIKDMGAMASLNLESNRLGVEGAKIIAAILPKCT
jgi:Ran GTPase-activating protein (RanGAP) involved in mRNA processing and transport